MRVTDRRTGGRTEGHTDGQNYDSQDRASIAASSGKKSNMTDGAILRTVKSPYLTTVRSIFMKFGVMTQFTVSTVLTVKIFIF